MRASIGEAFQVAAIGMLLVISSIDCQSNVTSEATTILSILMSNGKSTGTPPNSTVVTTVVKETIIKPLAREDDSKVSRPIDTDILPALEDEAVSLDQLFDEDPADEVPLPRQYEGLSCRRFCRRFCQYSDDGPSCRERCRPNCRRARY